MKSRKIEKAVKPAIYKGNNWNNPLSEVVNQQLIRRLTPKQISGIETLLAQERGKDKGFRSQGIPDRTLILPDQEIRIIYGGNTGDEILIFDLPGKQLRYVFHSQKLLTLLNQTEGMRGYLRYVMAGFFISLALVLILSIILFKWLFR